MKKIVEWMSEVEFPPQLREGTLLPDSTVGLTDRTLYLHIRSEQVSGECLRATEEQIASRLRLREVRLVIEPVASAADGGEEDWGDLLEQADSPAETAQTDRFLQEREEELRQYVHQVSAAADSSGKEVGSVLYGKKFKGKPEPLITLGREFGNVIVEGEFFKTDKIETKRGYLVYSAFLTDRTSSVKCKLFQKEKALEEKLDQVFCPGQTVIIRGKYEEDSFEHEPIIAIDAILRGEKKERTDDAPEKRIELHLHTQMSAMDGMAAAEDLVKTAAKWGHSAVAITDHGVVQSFPLAFKALGDVQKKMKKDLKIIYGVEAYLVPDTLQITSGTENAAFSDSFVVFDLETTGLSCKTGTIIEIGAVRVEGGVVREVFSEFVNPGRAIPGEITELTGISDAMVADAPPIGVILPRFLEFAGDSVLVAHNASFDLSFLREEAGKLGKTVRNTVLDTLELSRAMFPELGRHKLNTVAKHLGVSLEHHHRACDDAAATAQILIKCFERLRADGIECGICDLNAVLAGKADIKAFKSYHAVILVQNLTGLHNLYRLISEAHLHYFYKKPRIPKSLFLQYREGLLIGSACEAGELFQALVRKASEDEIAALAEFYDYYEVQPIGNNRFMVREGIAENDEELQELNKRILALGEQYGKLVVATGDVHFLNPEDAIYREVLMTAQGFSDAANQAPLYFHTTEEMLAEFSYLPEETARRIVIENPAKIAEMIEVIRPTPAEAYPPKMEHAAEDLTELCYNKAKRIYGDPLPEIISTRLERELTPIIANGYAVMYMIAQKLVARSNANGYMVGSRGSVGSSLVAFMAGITEVNALVPHYVCPKCRYSEFITDASYGSGCDMPDKACPECGEPVMKKDGHNIPFETFLGFNADKEPDIDLNFSGDDQPGAHKYVETLFGEGNVFRAGTIGTVAEKTAYGFVLKYEEERGITLSGAERERLAIGCTGVKRTTGQHPGGIIVVPKETNIYQFCPIQHPADDRTTDIITTHYEYHSIDKNLLKLDILGHDDPTVIRMLENLTGLDSKEILLDDEQTMRIFTGTEVLGVTPEQIDSTVGTYGIPEFGTNFTRKMLVETKPTTFAELVRISGLAHGTDVWTNNAEDLIVNDGLTLMDVICTRDDIMGFLIRKGLPNLDSFKIMESVRKGKGLTPEQEQLMRENGVEDWYIDSCKKIKYMFPKAHAVAYVTTAFRIAYFKVNYPVEYYCTYFSIRADNFDAAFMCRGVEVARKKKQELVALPKPTAKDKEMVTILELCIEMYERGIGFLPISLTESDGVHFLPAEGKKIRPSLNALSGLGDNAAKAIVAAREQEPFFSIEDLQQRAGLNKTVLETLRAQGCLDGMDETSQMTFF